jgi:hypothetical protein
MAVGFSGWMNLAVPHPSFLFQFQNTIRMNTLSVVFRKYHCVRSIRNEKNSGRRWEHKRNGSVRRTGRGCSLNRYSAVVIAGAQHREPRLDCQGSGLGLSGTNP